MKVKNLLFLMFFLIAITQRSNLLAQRTLSMTTNSAGIYLTFEDFETGKITNGFKPYQKNYFLWPRAFLDTKILH